MQALARLEHGRAQARLAPDFRNQGGAEPDMDAFAGLRPPRKMNRAPLT